MGHPSHESLLTLQSDVLDHTTTSRGHRAAMCRRELRQARLVHAVLPTKFDNLVRRLIHDGASYR